MIRPPSVAIKSEEISWTLHKPSITYANGPVWMPQALKPLCVIHIGSWENSPFPLYPRLPERRMASRTAAADDAFRGREERGKGNPPKVNKTQGFQYLGHSNWSIFCLLSWFLSKMFPTFDIDIVGPHFLLPQREETGKGNQPKVDETQGFQHLGHSNQTNCSQLNSFCPKFSPPLSPSREHIVFYIANAKRVNDALNE